MEPKKGRARRTFARVMYIAAVVLLLSTAAVAGAALWVSHDYKHVLMQRIPQMILKSSDSIYHISFSDIDIQFASHKAIIRNVRLTADTVQVNRLRTRMHYSPNTVSNVFAPVVEIRGLYWEHILWHKTLDCSHVIVHDPVWFMETIKHHPDLTMIDDKDGASGLNRLSIACLEIRNPRLAYHFVGDHYTYYFYLKGGSAMLNRWAVDEDIAKDTSVFIYARNGNVRPDSAIFSKDGVEYRMKKPTLEFSSTNRSVTLNAVIKNMTDVERKSGEVLEVYNLRFPEITTEDFNWKRLLHYDVLYASHITAQEPYIGVHYVREKAPTDKDRTGAFPNQLMHEAIQTDIKKVTVKAGKIFYTEPEPKPDTTFVLQFDDVNGTFTNVTNIDTALARHSNCIVRLRGRYMEKSPIAATFDLSLTDPRGHFVVDGFVNNLNGDDVSKQAAAFTFAKVTSFNLTHMTGHIEGDESYAQGDFTMLYNGLKISLFKFKSDDRKSKKGPLTFLANTLLLYPSNPMPGKGPRTASAIVHRDPNHGFIYLIWKDMYMAAQKTAVRDERTIALAGGQTDRKEDPPKKEGFFKRLFGHPLFK
jgi:hypothetical protein